MRRRLGFRSIGVALTLVVCCFLSAAAAGAVPTTAPPATTTTGPTGPPPKAYIVVDVASGIVLAASNDRVALPPASLTKILTALAAVAALAPDAKVPVSDRAAGMPARKLSMKAGEVWGLSDTLHALLMSSANDAAAALAERVSGSLENFHGALDAVAAHLGLADGPRLTDAAGLDDSFSIGGGNLISARDLAIAGRALLAEPRLAPIVAQAEYSFTDPGGVAHKLINHNRMLRTYQGAIGLKTGYTEKAGRGLVVAATRRGRTTLAVVIDVADMYGWGGALLDQAFASPVPASGPRLAPVPRPLQLRGLDAPVAPTPHPNPTPSTTAHHGAEPGLNVGFEILAGAALLVVALRVRIHRRSRRTPAAPIRRLVDRQPDARLTPHYEPDAELAERFYAAAREPRN